MKQISGPTKKAPAEAVLKDIRRVTRRQFTAEEKIRIVLEGLRGEESIAELCRREGISSSMYYGWSKEFLEAGKKRLAGDTARAATSDEGRYDEAEPLYRRALDGQERALGPEHPDTLTSVNNLAILYWNRGRYTEAKLLYRRALEGREHMLGPAHPDTLASLDNLARLYSDQGRYAEAAPLMERALKGRERVLGLEHPDTLASITSLVGIYTGQGRYAEAEALRDRAPDGVEP